MEPSQRILGVKNQCKFYDLGFGAVMPGILIANFLVKIR